MKTELLPCPGCGDCELAIMPADEESFDPPVQVQCFMCGMSGPIAESEIGAIAYWNSLPRHEGKEGKP